MDCMPIYEFACPSCRRIFSFLSKRVGVSKKPACPKCGNRKLLRQVSAFALTRGGGEEDGAGGPGGLPDLDDPKFARVMSDMERDMEGMDENNPRHMAHFLKKLKGVLGDKALPKEFDAAVRRLEAGEDPEKVEQEMGPIFDQLMGSGKAEGAYAQDPNLYDL